MLRQYVYERDKGICQDCGKQIELTNSNIHHVHELNKGGTNHPSNLKTLCIDCHKLRHPWLEDGRDKLNKMRENGMID